MAISSLPRLPDQVELPSASNSSSCLPPTMDRAAGWKTSLAQEPRPGAPAPAGVSLAPLQPRALPALQTGQPLDAADRTMLERLLGPALLAGLQKMPMRPGLGQTDATFGLIEIAGGKSTAALRMLSLMAGDPAVDGAALADLLNGWVPPSEMRKGTTRELSMQALCEGGIPDGCMAVLVCARHSAQAFAVMALDRRQEQVYCMVSQSDAATGMLRKFGVAEFSAIAPRAIAGVTGIVFGVRT